MVDGARGLGEVMNYPAVLGRDPEMLGKIRACSGMGVDGHAPGLGAELPAYVSAGIGSDHEAATREEAYQRLALGMTVIVREASSSTAGEPSPRARGRRGRS